MLWWPLDDAFTDDNDIMYGKDWLVLVVVLGLRVCGYWAQIGNIDDGGVVIDGAKGGFYYWGDDAICIS